MTATLTRPQRPTAPPTDTGTTLLTDDMLAASTSGRRMYDRENRFFDEDFDELRESGYLLAAVPTEFGGAGLGLDEVNRAAAPARLRRAGHRRRRQHAPLLDRRRRRPAPRRRPRRATGCSSEAAEGEVFAAGHGEAGNDIPLLLSTPKAERVDGGWEITGHKIFGSLSPVWTYLGFHAMDTSDPDAPADRPRLPATATRRGYRIVETWDTLGMRATQSQRHDPRPGVRPRRARSRWCARPASPAPACSRSASSPGRCSASPPSTPASPSGPSTSRSTRMHERTSIALTRSMAHHPEVQHHVAEMRIAPRGDRRPTSTASCDDWATGVDHGMDWPVQLVAAQVRRRQPGLRRRRHAPSTSPAARGIFKRSRLEQLFRDARIGRFHPGNTLLTHELVGKLCLGINPDEQPRWG